MTRLQTIRLSKRMTRGDLAERADVSARTIWNLERSGTVPRDETLFALAKALRVDPTDLIDPKPEPVAESA